MGIYGGGHGGITIPESGIPRAAAICLTSYQSPFGPPEFGGFDKDLGRRRPLPKINPGLPSLGVSRAVFKGKWTSARLILIETLRECNFVPPGPTGQFPAAGDIVFGEREWEKFHDEDEFMVDLAPVIAAGSEFFWATEEDDKWKFEFDGTSVVCKQGKVVYE